MLIKCMRWCYLLISKVFLPQQHILQNSKEVKEVMVLVEQVVYWLSVVL